MNSTLKEAILEVEALPEAEREEFARVARELVDALLAESEAEGGAIPHEEVFARLLSKTQVRGGATPHPEFIDELQQRHGDRAPLSIADRGGSIAMAYDVELIAVADYRREDYDRLVALAPDGGGMEKTYDEWKKYADEAIVVIATSGKRVVRITVDPDEFAAWLRLKRLKSEPGTRAQYAVELARKLYATSKRV